MFYYIVSDKKNGEMYQRSYSVQNLFFTNFIFYLFLLQNVPILQHAIASKSNHSNIMLPNVMVLAPLQELKIKYELKSTGTCLITSHK
jgi:hypothetical protein